MLTNKKEIQVIIYLKSKVKVIMKKEKSLSLGSLDASYTTSYAYCLIFSLFTK